MIAADQGQDSVQLSHDDPVRHSSPVNTEGNVTERPAKEGASIDTLSISPHRERPSSYPYTVFIVGFPHGIPTSARLMHDLKTLLSVYGKPFNVRLIDVNNRDANAYSHGYVKHAFASFASKEEVDRVTESFTGTPYQGAFLRVEPARADRTIWLTCHREISAESLLDSFDLTPAQRSRASQLDLHSGLLVLTLRNVEAIAFVFGEIERARFLQAGSFEVVFLDRRDAESAYEAISKAKQDQPLSVSWKPAAFRKDTDPTRQARNLPRWSPSFQYRPASSQRHRRSNQIEEPPRSEGMPAGGLHDEAKRNDSMVLPAEDFWDATKLGSPAADHDQSIRSELSTCEMLSSTQGVSTEAGVEVHASATASSTRWDVEMEGVDSPDQNSSAHVQGKSTLSEKVPFLPRDPTIVSEGRRNFGAPRRQGFGFPAPERKPETYDNPSFGVDQHSIWVGNLAHGLDARILFDLFKVYGRITRPIERHKAFAFITFESVEAAKKAIRGANGIMCFNRNLVVRHKERRKSWGSGFTQPFRGWNVIPSHETTQVGAGDATGRLEGGAGRVRYPASGQPSSPSFAKEEVSPDSSAKGPTESRVRGVGESSPSANSSAKHVSSLPMGSESPETEGRSWQSAQHDSNYKLGATESRPAFLHPVYHSPHPYQAMGGSWIYVSSQQQGQAPDEAHTRGTSEKPMAPGRRVASGPQPVPEGVQFTSGYPSPIPRSESEPCALRTESNGTAVFAGKPEAGIDALAKNQHRLSESDVGGLKHTHEQHLEVAVNKDLEEAQTDHHVKPREQPSIEDSGSQLRHAVSQDMRQSKSSGSDTTPFVRKQADEIDSVYSQWGGTDDRRHKRQSSSFSGLYPSPLMTLGQPIIPGIPLQAFGGTGAQMPVVQVLPFGGSAGAWWGHPWQQQPIGFGPGTGQYQMMAGPSAPEDHARDLNRVLPSPRQAHEGASSGAEPFLTRPQDIGADRTRKDGPIPFAMYGDVAGFEGEDRIPMLEIPAYAADI